MTKGPMVAISWGDLIDKLTILEIKEQRLTSAAAVANVRRELSGLLIAIADTEHDAATLNALKAELKAVNQTLWDIEDQIRAKESSKAFDREFIELARSVYRNNDRRAALKRRIDVLLKSELVEEKQYTSYTF